MPVRLRCRGVNRAGKQASAASFFGRYRPTVAGRLYGRDALLLLGLHLNECEAGARRDNREDRVIDFERQLHPVQFFPIIDALLRGSIAARTTR